MTTVTDADREAAADYFGMTNDALRADFARSGKYDLSVCVQAFARHREAEVAVAALEREEDEIRRAESRIEEFAARHMDADVIRIADDLERRRRPMRGMRSWAPPSRIPCARTRVLFLSAQRRRPATITASAAIWRAGA